MPQGITAVLSAPTASVCLLQRIFTRDTGEYDTLHSLQDAIRLSPLTQWGSPEAKFPPVDLSRYAIQAMRMTRDSLQFFEYMNWYIGLNPPPESDSGLMELFKTAGVGPGSQLPTEPYLREAIAEGVADAQALINARITEGPFRNGWRMPYPNSRLAGPFVRERAAIQMTQMGLFPLAEAIYFFAYRDGTERPSPLRYKYPNNLDKEDSHVELANEL